MPHLASVVQELERVLSLGTRDELIMARVVRVKVGPTMNRSFDAALGLRASSETEGVLVVLNATSGPKERTRVFLTQTKIDQSGRVQGVIAFFTTQLCGGTAGDQEYTLVHSQRLRIDARRQ